MALTVTGPWEWTSDYSRQYAPTNDPRVIAVIERDSEPTAPDGDMAPAYWATPDHAWNYSEPEHVAYWQGPDDDAVLDALARADDAMLERRWTNETVERYLRIFYGAAVRIIPTQRYRNDTPIVVLNTAPWRELVGIEDGPDKAHLDGEVSELTAWLNGDVFGVGYGVMAERVIDTGGSIDPDDFEIEIQCWGFYGEDYARESASAFEYGEPELPALLDLSKEGV